MFYRDTGQGGLLHTESQDIRPNYHGNVLFDFPRISLLGENTDGAGEGTGKVGGDRERNQCHCGSWTPWCLT